MFPGFNLAIAPAIRPMEQPWNKDSRWLCKHITNHGNFSVFEVLLVSLIRCEARGGGVCAAPSGRVSLRRFGPKTGIHFVHFGLESGWVFEGTTGVYEHFYRFNSK